MPGLDRKASYRNLCNRPNQIYKAFRSTWSVGGADLQSADQSGFIPIQPTSISPLAPIRHRSAQTQADLAVIRSRDELVRSRTMLINHVRGMVKSSGARLPSCTAGNFSNKAAPVIPEALQPALLPILYTIAALTQEICAYDRQIETLCQESYPETCQLHRISGVGPLTALAFVLTLGDPRRFPKSRQVGPALGLVPRGDQSGDHEPQLRITKSGDAYLRQLLVNCAHYILGPFGLDRDLRRWGQQLAERGGKNAK